MESGADKVTKKQNGMTLVEVLATLLISSLVIMLIWTTVMISMRFNIVETKKMQMQQTANFIITDIQRIHRSKECYEFKKDNDVWLSYDCVSEKTITIYDDSQYTISIKDQPTDKIRTNYKNINEYKGEYEDSYDLTVKINDKTNEKLFVKISTKISRIDERP